MYHFHISSLILLCAVAIGLGGQCQKKEDKEMSKTKCVAGRIFFARLDKIPSFSHAFSEATLVKPYNYPWIAQVRGNYAGRTTFCTGTLINDRYIITAQHCVLPPFEPPQLMVILGYTTMEPSQSLDPTGAPRFGQYNVLSIILHPNFDYLNLQTSSNDVALLKIPPVRYSKTIYPIQLPSIADKYYDFSNAIAENVGWQSPSIAPRQGHSFANTFEKLTVKIISNNDCGSFNVYYKHAINPGVLCTTNIKEESNGICTGDTGAPLTIEDTERVYNNTVLVGITSWNSPRTNPCAWQGSPIVYVRVDQKLQWILDNTRDALYCKY